MAFARGVHKPSTNWFLTWDDQSRSDGKSFLLQIKFHNLLHRNPTTDVINSYAVIHRRHNGEHTFIEVGTTSMIPNDPNPQYPDGFRVYYDQHTDLTDDLLRVICYHRREVAPSYHHVLGSATITLRELLRAFGARVSVELIRKKDAKVVGSVWFIAEPLPIRSPRGGSNTMQFTLSVMHPKYAGVKFQFNTIRLFLVIERERSDHTWSVAYRSRVYKRDLVQSLASRSAYIVLDPFQVRQGELVLGMTATRKIRFSFFQKAKKGQPHFIVAHVVTTVAELMTEFQVHSSLDASIDSNVVGKFSNIARIDEHQLTSFDVQLNYRHLTEHNGSPHDDDSDDDSDDNSRDSSDNDRSLSNRFRASIRFSKS